MNYCYLPPEFVYHCTHASDAAGSVYIEILVQTGVDLGGAGYSEHGGADNRPPERATLQSVIDSERQPTGVDLGGARYCEHGGADNRPSERAGL